MSGLAATFVLQTVLLTTGAHPYSQAYAAANASGRPMLVMVSAPWCPSCSTMKQTTMKQLENEGMLGDVEFVLLDADEDRELCLKMMDGGRIPQLILYEQTEKGSWSRQIMVGKKSVREVQSVIQPAIARHQHHVAERQAAMVQKSKAVQTPRTGM